MKNIKLGPKVRFKKAKLPLKKKLMGKYTILEPLNVAKHSKELYFQYSKDKKNIIWTYLPYGPFQTYSKFKYWLKTSCLNSDPFFYAIYSKRHNQYCGMASYLRIEPDHGSIEVGHINYSPLLQNLHYISKNHHLILNELLLCYHQLYLCSFHFFLYKNNHFLN